LVRGIPLATAPKQKVEPIPPSYQLPPPLPQRPQFQRARSPHQSPVHPVRAPFIQGHRLLPIRVNRHPQQQRQFQRVQFPQQSVDPLRAPVMQRHRLLPVRFSLHPQPRIQLHQVQSAPPQQPPVRSSASA